MKSVKGQRIALIGGAGFIGHNLALKLRSLGAEVSIVDGLEVNNLLYLNQTTIDIVNRQLYIDFIMKIIYISRKIISIF